MQTLLQLKQNGTLKHLVLNGLMSHKVFLYLEIYMWIDARLKTSTQSIKTVVNDAEITFQISRATVWRAIKVIKSLEEE